MQKFRAESFRLSSDEIRIEIARRSEKEKMLIISMFDRKSKEERSLELIKKHLGIGDWAVGGTTAIRVYNPEQYERDREQRAQMGFNDFSQIPEAQAQDQFYERNAAYDTQQTGEDDH